MSLTSDHLEEKKKKKKQNAENIAANGITKDYLENKPEEEDIAPIRPKTEEAPVDNRKWYEKGLFEDGYQFGDISKTLWNKAKEAETDFFTSDEVTKTMLGLYNPDPKKPLSEWAENAALKGVNAFNKSFTATADLILGTPLKALGWEDNPVTKLNDYYQGTYDYYAEKTAELSGDSKALNVGGQFIEGTVAALPTAILALMTSGASLGASSSTLASNAAMQSGNWLSKLGLTVEAMTKNPQYWLSFAQTLGNDYEEAKEQGASDNIAMLGATVSSLVNAGIEIGVDGASGIQGLPDEVAEGGVKPIVAWLQSAAEEGGEEGVQYLVSNAVTKMLYDHDVELVNPQEMLGNIAMGTAVGGALGGGQIAVQHALGNIAQQTETKTEKPELNEIEKTVVDKVYKDALAEAEKQGKKLTDKEKAKLYDRAVESMDKGYIPIDTIEEVLGEKLGGNAYQTYKATVESEDAILKEYEELGNVSNPTLAQSARYTELGEQVKQIKNDNLRGQLKTILSEEIQKQLGDTRLVESYNDKIRRTEHFTADLEQYTDANERQKEYGNFNIYSKDVRYSPEAPVQEAPMQEGQEEVQEAYEPTTTVLPDDFAPIDDTWDRIASLEDTDAPPELESMPTMADPIPLDKKTLDSITKEVQNTLVLNKEQLAEVRDLIQEYSEAEFPNREMLYDAISDRFGKASFTETNEEVKAVKAELKRHKINVNEIVKRSIPDYVHFFRSNFGKIRFSKEGVGVDQAYQELSSMYPDFFPPDITNDTDQLLQIAEVANMGATYENTFEVDEEFLNEATDIIVDGVSAYKQSQRQIISESVSKESLDSYMKELGADIAPVVETAPKQAYEAIRPPKSTEPKMTSAPKEPKMKRVTTKDGKEERSFVGTAAYSEAVDGIITPDDIPDDARYYQVKSNEETLATANARLERYGYEKSKAYFEGRITDKKLTPEDMALGQRLIQEAAKAGDGQGVIDLIIDTSIIGTELGQTIQAMSMMRRLSPEGQLKALYRVVERGKAKGDKAFKDVEVTKEQADKILGVYKKTSEETVKMLQDEIAKLDGASLTRTDAFWVSGDTYKHKDRLKELGFKWDKEKKAWYLNDASGTFDQAELDRVVEEVKQEIANKMKRTGVDYINSWRMLSMLGNPKTHARNIISNAAMAVARLEKNIIARSIEDGATLAVKGAEKVASAITGKERHFDAPIKTRTKTWKPATEAVKSYAKQTTEEMEAEIKGEPKYSDEGSIKAKRKIFFTKAANWYNYKNFEALEAEDAMFSKPAFRSTLAEYLTANGIKTEADIKNNPELVVKAKQHALDEARNATFRQDSFLANEISKIERKNAALGVAVGALMPFKKTPINIAKTGLSYSPLGFARSIYDAIKVYKGEMEASEAIDHLAQALTGTSLAVIGYALASNGILNGAGEDDNEGEYEYQLGKQAYSFNFNGASYSLNWLSPAAMPLFVGANAYEQFVEDKDWNGDVVVESLAQTIDPMSEMSVLSGLVKSLSSYAQGTGKFADIGLTMAQNYISQFIPTLSSQLAATIDDTKRSTKVGKDSDFKAFDQTVNSLKYKIPFLRQTLEPTTDIWGNEVKQSENVLTRAFENFIAPYSKREDITSSVDEELKSLYSTVGDTGLLPSTPNDYFSYDKTKYEMSAEEHTDFKKLYGQTAYELLEDLFATTTYQSVNAETKADMVNDVYDFARDKAKQAFLRSRAESYDDTDNSIEGAIEHDMEVDEYEFYTEKPEKYAVAKAVGGYDAYKTYTSEMWDIKADKDENGNSIRGSRKDKIYDYVFSKDIDYGEKAILFKSEYPADDTFNYDIINYLDSREDITWEEMKNILEELDFTVYDDGTIEW